MRKLHPILPTVLLVLLLGGPLAAAPIPMPNPDFTKGETIPEGASKDWNLGATGARGWMHSHQQGTFEARQVLITKVAEGSPADGVLVVGDVILGVAGKPFSYDPRQEWGMALTAAEAADGKFALTRWREGKTDQVTLELPVLGSYSPTAPYDCEKSKQTTPFSPPSGQATGSFNGLHTESKFLAARDSTGTTTRRATFSSVKPSAMIWWTC